MRRQALRDDAADPHGPCGHHPPDAAASSTEPHPYQPNSPYSASKAASDHLVRAWHHTYGLPVTTSNCSNSYGLWHFPEKLIPLMIVKSALGHPSGTMSTKPPEKP